MFEGDKYPKTRLGDFVSIRTGKLDANASSENGKYPFFTCGVETLKIDDYAFDCEAVLLAGNGEFCVKYYNGKFNAYQRTYVIETLDNNVISVPYLYAWFGQYAKVLRGKAIGGIIKYIKMGDLTEAKISFPPLEVQNSYVAIAQQADKSKFSNLKSQFIEMFGNGNWEQKALGEVGTFKRGGGFQKSDYVESGIPCIHYGQIHTKFGPFIYSHITEISSDLESKTKFAGKGDLIIAITSEDTEGSCKSTAWLGDYPVAVGGHAAIFHHCMNPVYMSFFFKSALFNYAKMEYVHGTKVCEIKPDDIAKILVPCPPMSLQEDFSEIAQQADKSKLIQNTLLNNKLKFCYCYTPRHISS